MAIEQARRVIDNLRRSRSNGVAGDLPAAPAVPRPRPETIDLGQEQLRRDPAYQTFVSVWNTHARSPGRLERQEQLGIAASYLQEHEARSQTVRDGFRKELDGLVKERARQQQLFAAKAIYPSYRRNPQPLGNAMKGVSRKKNELAVFDKESETQRALLERARGNAQRALEVYDDDWAVRGDEHRVLFYAWRHYRNDPKKRMALFDRFAPRGKDGYEVFHKLMQWFAFLDGPAQPPSSYRRLWIDKDGGQVWIVEKGNLHHAMRQGGGNALLDPTRVLERLDTIVQHGAKAVGVAGTPVTTGRFIGGFSVPLDRNFNILLRIEERDILFRVEPRA